MIAVADFTSVINQVLPEPHAGLLNGIIFGTKASLSRDFLQALITTGTLHIVALSGMNISILVGAMQGTLLRVASRRVTHLLTILLPNRSHHSPKCTPTFLPALLSTLRIVPSQFRSLGQ